METHKAYGIRKIFLPNRKLPLKYRKKMTTEPAPKTIIPCCELDLIINTRAQNIKNAETILLAKSILLLRKYPKAASAAIARKLDAKFGFPRNPTIALYGLDQLIGSASIVCNVQYEAEITPVPIKAILILFK